MQKIPTSAVPMLTAVIPRVDTTALVIRVIMEMERIVNQVSWQILEKFRKSDESDDAESGDESDAPSKMLFCS